LDRCNGMRPVGRHPQNSGAIRANSGFQLKTSERRTTRVWPSGPTRAREQQRHKENGLCTALSKQAECGDGRLSCQRAANAASGAHKLGSSHSAFSLSLSLASASAAAAAGPSVRLSVYPPPSPALLSFFRRPVSPPLASQPASKRNVHGHKFCLTEIRLPLLRACAPSLVGGGGGGGATSPLGGRATRPVPGGGSVNPKFELAGEGSWQFAGPHTGGGRRPRSSRWSPLRRPARPSSGRARRLVGGGLGRRGGALGRSAANSHAQTRAGGQGASRRQTQRSERTNERTKLGLAGRETKRNALA